LKLPLLERQMNKIKELMNHEMERRELDPVKPVKLDILPLVTKDMIDSPQLSLFPEVDNDIDEYSVNGFLLSSELQAFIKEYLNRGAESARIICELLIKNQGLPNKRYQSGKPKLYPAVCHYLDTLLSKQEIQLKSYSHEDRIYQNQLK
jgi:hypothetical protein